MTDQNPITDDLFLGHRPTDGIQEARTEKRRLMIGVGLVLALVVASWARPAPAAPWTDENGSPNPKCLSENCHLTGTPDAPKPQDQRGDDPREDGSGSE